MPSTGGWRTSPPRTRPSCGPSWWARPASAAVERPSRGPREQTDERDDPGPGPGPPRPVLRPPGAADTRADARGAGPAGEGPGRVAEGRSVGAGRPDDRGRGG